MYKISKFAPLIVCLFLLMGLMISYGGNQEVPQAENQEVELAENQESEQGAGGGEGRPRGTAFNNPPTNLQILKVEKATDLRPIMRSFNAGLGEECGFCHEWPDYAKDTEHKERARDMIEMVRHLNSEVFTWPDAPRATCFMCHRGHEEPEFQPPPEESDDTETPAGSPGKKSLAGLGSLLSPAYA